jgi:hypothetical protein
MAKTSTSSSSMESWRKMSKMMHPRKKTSPPRKKKLIPHQSRRTR